MPRESLKLVLTLCFVLPVRAGTVWVEGESADNPQIRRNGWYADVKKEELSAGGALSHWGDQEGRASYRVEIPEDGKYALWLRANPVQAEIKVRVGDGDWRAPDLRRESFEKINLAADNKPDLRFIGWVNAGVSDLTAGPTRVEVRFVSKNHFHGMLDSFCLTTDLDWKPRKTLKPGEELPHWPIPEITQANLAEWVEFIRPSAGELGWRAVRWHGSLSEAAAEAEKLRRPILLWAMNGHPCGET